MNNRNTYNHGVDILRSLAMLGVVTLHVLGHGGILNSTQSLTTFSIAWFLEILAYPAVNCFLLISGYVGYKGERVFPKIRNLVSLWFSVVFYSVLLFFLFKLFGPDPLGAKDLLKSFLPTIANEYWFFTAYFGLFLLMPLLNSFVHKTNFKVALIFIISFLVFSILSVIQDSFSILGGYSVIWFVFMYLIGAITRKYDLTKIFSRKVWTILVILSFAATFFSKVILYYTNIPFLQSHSGELVKYISPTIVLMAIGFLAIFSNTKHSFRHPSAIAFFSSSAFSVYLIHDNVYMRKYIIANIYKLADGLNWILLALFIICSAIIIFVSCVLIDKGRVGLFRLLKIDKLSMCIESFCKAKINIIYNMFTSKLKKTAE